MTSTSYWTVATSWVDRCLGEDVRVPRNPRMPVQSDRIYSYGDHFELARLVRDGKDEPLFFLVNGDIWGTHSTARHQSEVRGALAHRSARSVILPHSALHAAGIDLDSIRVLERTGDRTEVREIVHELPDGELPIGARVFWEPIKEQVGLTPNELYAKVDEYNLKQYEEWAAHQSWTGNGLGRRRYLFEKCPNALTLPQWLRMHHDASWHGAPKDYNLERETEHWVVVGHRRAVYTNGRKNSEWDVEYLAGGTTEYRREIRRHWLGESLIEARVAYTVTRRCKWCRGTGRGEGPVLADWVSPSRIMERVYLPDVKDPIHRGRYISVDTLRIRPGHWDERAWTIPDCPDCRGRGQWREVRHRTARFLSAFDRNETRQSYYFCELPPKATAVTIEQALDQLKPDAVRLAEQMGREVKRQGDIFAIPLPAATKRQLNKAGARYERRGSLFSTNHVATETAYLPDGTTLVRGILHHAPEFRRPDHARVRLGNVWHVAQKNLVPIAA